MDSGCRGEEVADHFATLTMAKQYLRIDAWIKEAEEASKLVEVIELRVKNYTKSNCDSEAENIKESAQSKLLELSVKYDRLESLLRNPPSEPTLTDEDVDFRWTILSDIQQRARAAARCLYISTPSHRPPSLHPASPDSAGSITRNDEDYLSDALYKGDLELQRPFVSDGENRTKFQLWHISSWDLKRCAWKVCWAFNVVLGAAVILVVLLLIVAALQCMHSA